MRISCQWQPDLDIFGFHPWKPWSLLSGRQTGQSVSEWGDDVWFPNISGTSTFISEEKGQYLTWIHAKDPTINTIRWVVYSWLQSAPPPLDATKSHTLALQSSVSCFGFNVFKDTATVSLTSFHFCRVHWGYEETATLWSEGWVSTAAVALCPERPEFRPSPEPQEAQCTPTRVLKSPTSEPASRSHCHRSRCHYCLQSYCIIVVYCWEWLTFGITGNCPIGSPTN